MILIKTPRLFPTIMPLREKILIRNHIKAIDLNILLPERLYKNIVYKSEFVFKLN